MPKPLLSQSVEKPQDIQFKHFGVMNSGEQSKASVFTSVTLNIILVVIALIISASVKTISDNRKKEDLTYVEPIKPLPPKPPPPKLVPPKPPPPKIVPPKIEPPKIVRPEVKIPDPPKPVPVKMEEKPTPVMKMAPPKVVTQAAAPKVTNVNLAHAASVVNNDPQPSAVRLGQSKNPIVPSDRPAVANAPNLGRAGMPGMNAANTGSGPRATAVNMGSGGVNGTMGGTSNRPAVSGVRLGVPGGTGTGPGNATGNRPATVQLGRTETPTSPGQPNVQRLPASKGPQVIAKPRAIYTADATAARVEGSIQVRIHVAANGAVTVTGIAGGLGHGLDEEARRVAQGTRFKPATDASGNPVDWDGTETVTFQLAG